MGADSAIAIATGSQGNVDAIRSWRRRRGANDIAISGADIGAGYPAPLGEFFAAATGVRGRAAA